MRCHMCGRSLKQERDIIREDYLLIKKDWGYFSGKDGQRHEFCLCEDCYDKLTALLKLPVEIEENTELL